MAQFDNTPQVQDAPNFTSRSQGITSSPNTALATLFESVASAFEGGVKIADQAQKDQILDDIFAGADAVRSEFGVDDATLMEADAESQNPLPAGIQAAGENLARLENAHRKGPKSGVSESHYWARMNNMVRQLRAKYPGYRQEIDQMVSSVTGATPANALRSALFNEWNSGAESDPYAKFADWAMKDGSLPADFFQRQENGNPYGLVELQAAVSTTKRKQSEMTESKKQLEYANSMGTLNQKEALRVFQSEAAMTVTNLLQDSTSVIGTSYTALTERIQEAQRAAAQGAPVDTNYLRTAYAEFKGLVQSELRGLSMQQFGSTAADSYISMISDPQAIDAAINQAMAPLNIIEDAILNEQYGVVGSMAAWLESTKDLNSKELLQALPEIGRLQALKETAGPTVVDLLLMLQPQLQSSLAKRLLDNEAVHAASGTSNIVEGFDKGEANDQGEEYYNGLIKRWQNTIQEATNGSLPLEVIQNNVQYMFGVDSQAVFARMSNDDKYEYYRQVVSPTVTNQMLQIKKSGDEASWNTYQSWATNAFVGLFRESVQGLQEVNTSARYSGMQVRWDKNLPGFVIQGQGIAGIGAYTTPATNMNTAIQTITPILRANNEDVSENILELIEGMGWDPTADREAGYGLIEALANAVRSVSSPEDTEAMRGMFEENLEQHRQGVQNRFGGSE